MRRTLVGCTSLSVCSCARLIGAILISFLSNLHGDSNVISRSAKRAKLIALLVLLLFVPGTICRGQRATEDQKEYDRILQLISNEDWKAASDAAVSYLAKTGTSEDLQARLRYIVIYTTEGAVSTGAFDFDVLNKRLKGFVGKSVTLPDRPVINDAQPGRMNAICISDPRNIIHGSCGEQDQYNDSRLRIRETATGGGFGRACWGIGLDNGNSPQDRA